MPSAPCSEELRVTALAGRRSCATPASPTSGPVSASSVPASRLEDFVFSPPRMRPDYAAAAFYMLMGGLSALTSSGVGND